MAYLAGFTGSGAFIAMFRSGVANLMLDNGSLVTATASGTNYSVKNNLSSTGIRYMLIM